MQSLLIAAAAATAAATSWTDDFATFNPALWSQQSDVEHCSDGACCQMRPDHLLYGPAGLTALMNQSPCNTTGGCGSAHWAAGHLRTNSLVSYGTWAVEARIAHSPSGGATPANAFTCFGGYVGAPAHNEISMCWEGNVSPPPPLAARAAFQFFHNGTPLSTNAGPGLAGSCLLVLFRGAQDHGTAGF